VTDTPVWAQGKGTIVFQGSVPGNDRPLLLFSCRGPKRQDGLEDKSEQAIDQERINQARGREPRQIGKRDANQDQVPGEEEITLPEYLLHQGCRLAELFDQARHSQVHSINAQEISRAVDRQAQAKRQPEPRCEAQRYGQGDGSSPPATYPCQQYTMHRPRDGKRQDERGRSCQPDQHNWRAAGACRGNGQHHVRQQTCGCSQSKTDSQRQRRHTGAAPCQYADCPTGPEK
jgi:hypothetical protein